MAAVKATHGTSKVAGCKLINGKLLINGGIKMTIKELKNLFTNDTEISIMSQDDDSILSVSLTHLLLDCPAFAEIPLVIQSVHAIGANEIVVDVDMPVEILSAWKKYSDDYYKAV